MTLFQNSYQNFILSGLISMCAIQSMPSHAQHLMPFPEDIPVFALEYGNDVATSGLLTVAGADKWGPLTPSTSNYQPTGLSAFSGAFYVFSRGVDQPIAEYKFNMTPERLDAPPVEIAAILDGTAPNPLRAPFMGARVDISSRWIVASIASWVPPYDVNEPKPAGKPALMIVERDETMFGFPKDDCKLSDGSVDCIAAGLEPMILDVPTSFSVGREKFDVAVSNIHLAYASKGHNSLFILEYDESTDDWVPSATFTNVNLTNADHITIDLSDSLVALGVTRLDSPGEVYASYKSRTGTWAPLKKITGTTGSFGRSVSLDDTGTIAVSYNSSNATEESDGYVELYGCGRDSTGCQFSQGTSFDFAGSHVSGVALDGNQLAVFRQNTEERLSLYRFYRPNLSASGSWHYIGGFDNTEFNQLHPNASTTHQFSNFDLNDGHLVLGWKGLPAQHNGQTVGNVGGWISLEPAAIFDPQLDPLGRIASDWNSMPLTLDAISAFVPDLIAFLPVLGNASGEAWYGKIRNKLPYATQWPVSVPYTGSYEVCVTYLNTTGNELKVVLVTDTNTNYGYRKRMAPLYLPSSEPQAGYYFQTECNVAPLLAGPQALSLLHEGVSVDKVEINPL